MHEICNDEDGASFILPKAHVSYSVSLGCFISREHSSDRSIFVNEYK